MIDQYVERCIAFAVLLLRQLLTQATEPTTSLNMAGYRAPIAYPRFILYTSK